MVIDAISDKLTGMLVDPSSKLGGKDSCLLIEVCKAAQPDLADFQGGTHRFTEQSGADARGRSSSVAKTSVPVTVDDTTQERGGDDK
jgi:hypothetical protein